MLELFSFVAIQNALVPIADREEQGQQHSIVKGGTLINQFVNDVEGKPITGTGQWPKSRRQNERVIIAKLGFGVLARPKHPSKVIVRVHEQQQISQWKKAAVGGFAKVSGG